MGGVEFCYTKTCYTRTVLVWTCGHLRARAHAHACRYTLFAGGFNKTGGESDVVDVYDSASGVWSVLKLSAPRALMTTAVTATAGGNTAAYFAGGQFRNGTKSDAIDVFTVSASSDGIAASTLVHSVLCLSSARSMLAATAVDGPDVTSQYVLFGGGELKENESHTSTTQDSAIVDVRIYTVYIPPVLFLLRLHKITAPLSTHADGHDCCGCHAYPHRCTTRMLQAGCIHRTT